MVKEEIEKPGLRSNIQKTKILASGPITSWQIDTEKVETVTDFLFFFFFLDFIFLSSKITVYGDCSLKNQIHLLLGEKRAMTNWDILKSRDIILPTKVHLVKTITFPVIMCGYESWTIKKVNWRIDALEVWWWRLLRVLGQQRNQTSQS